MRPGVLAAALALAGGAGCVGAPGPGFAAWPRERQLVFARSRVGAAQRGRWAGRAVLYAAAIAFTTGAVMVVSQSGDAIDHPKPVIRAGWLTMVAGAAGMAGGGIAAGHYDVAERDWSARLSHLQSRSPP